MNPPPGNFASLLGAAKRLLGRVPTLVEGRLDLLKLEVQAEREQLFHAILLMLGIVTFGLLAGITLTVGVVLLCWEHSPVTALFGLLACYAGGAAWMYARLQRLRARGE